MKKTGQTLKQEVKEFFYVYSDVLKMIGTLAVAGIVGFYAFKGCDSARQKAAAEQYNHKQVEKQKMLDSTIACKKDTVK